MKTRILLLSFIISIVYFTHNLWTAVELEERRAKKRAQIEEGRRNETPPLMNETMRAIIEINRNCTEHFYDIPEWTLQIFQEKDDKCAEKRKILFKENLVKTLIRGRGYENLGCRNDTPKCAEKAHYNQYNKVRVNTPPCCRAKIIEMFKHTTKALSRDNITHFLQFGALIGYYRNKHVVPYDSDIDLYMDKDYWIQSHLSPIIENLRKTYGYRFEFHDGGMKMKVFYSHSNNNSIDIWPFKVVFDKQQRPFVKIPHGAAVRQPMANIFPLRAVQFEGIWTFVPRKPKEVLDLQYGEGYWEKELDCKYFNIDGHCIPQSLKRMRTDVADDHVITYLLGFLLLFLILMILLFVLIIKCVPNK
ncbi:ribitol 5-phosphate transferase FKRP-like [Clytia hemisphaerica]|uniref:ribitol 5-phosphate transferase FKRP-like n=1 Tax=Clytia hemisphaerica TaxID=252671 RepID=UPI0034D6D46A